MRETTAEANRDGSGAKHTKQLVTNTKHQSQKPTQYHKVCHVPLFTLFGVIYKEHNIRY